MFRTATNTLARLLFARHDALASSAGGQFGAHGDIAPCLLENFFCVALRGLDFRITLVREFRGCQQDSLKKSNNRPIGNPLTVHRNRA